jgi:alpha-N-arabinofuranosidase
VVEDNGFGTHEFVRLCRQIGAEPYLAGNVGTGSPREMMEWVEYCNSTLDTSLARERGANGHPDPMRVRYWGVGNENWGCGGNFDAIDYAKEFRRFATFLKMADSDIELVACGHCDRDWNLRVVEALRGHLGYLDHLSVHRYYTAGSALGFSEAEHYSLMRAADLVEQDISFTEEILLFFTAGKRRVGIAFDEWGVWHPEARSDSDYEAPGTLRDAVAAAGILDVFHRRCRSVSMANLAQVVNVLQCLVQTREQRMWVTPTYHLFELYRPHRGATALRVHVECEEVPAEGLAALAPGDVALVSATASSGGTGRTLSLSNRSYDLPIEAEIRIRGEAIASVEWSSLRADSPAAHNSAENAARVRIRREKAGLADGTARITLPPCSVHTLALTAG